MTNQNDDSATTLQCTAAAPLDKLAVHALRGNEAVDQPFLFQLECISSDAALALDDALAKHVTVILRAGAVERQVDGLCARISQWPADPGFTRYALELRPWLWWLTLCSDNRIFQNLSTPDIAEAVFKGRGYTDYELKLTGTYTAREYCVQFGETDFSFVSRLLEEEGIFYFFRHESGRHVMVLADDSSNYLACPGQPDVAFMPGEAGSRELQVINGGEIRRQTASGAYKATDYAFKTPATSLYAQAEAGSANTAVSIYDYPGGYSTKSVGDALSKKRIDSLRYQMIEFVGDSSSRGMIPGYTFTLSGHERNDANIEWVVMEVQHQASHENYRNSFTAIPRATSYRPSRVTPKPRIPSTQTAIVVGKSGEEIWTDEFGRIKVQFHWDQLGKNDENSSCWIRVAHLWSGLGWGSQFIPRMGQEVVVSFVNGDPDQPLVTGCVYNGSNALPYALPAEQTKSTVKTQSSKGGGGFNEIRFEDKKDSEELYLHAQKDMKTEVLHDVTCTIGNDETHQVKNNQTIEVQEGDQKITVAKGNRVTDISAADDTLTVKGKRAVTVTGNETHANKADFTQTVDGNFKLTVSGNLTIEVTGAIKIKSSQDINAEAGMSITNKAGTSLTNQAGTELTNKAGTTLTNDAGVSLTSKAGATQTVDGGGMLTLKGGLVKIN